MASIPQLRADIVALQDKLRLANARIAELEADGQKVIEKPVAMPSQIVVEYRDRVVEVPGPERVVQDDAALDAAMLEISDLKARLDAAMKSARQVERVVEYVKIPSDPVEVIKYKDDPAKDAEISRLNAVIDDMRIQLMRERQKPPAIEYVDRVIEKPVQFEVVKVEYRDRVVEVPGPERVVTVEVPSAPVTLERIVHDTSAINAANAQIEKLKKQLSDERKKKRKVEIKTEYVKLPAKEIEVIKHKDNPAHIKEIKRLTEELTKCQLDLIAEQKKKQEVKVIERVIEKPVQMPSQVNVECFNRVLETVKYKDNPQLIKTIKELQRKLKEK